MKYASTVSPDPTAASYEFGPIRIDVTSRQVWRNGEIVVVPPKALDALIYLAAHSDRTVTKDELISAVWKDVSVSEDSLFHSMFVLRRALGDDSTHPHLIVTVPRKGYRLNGPVRAVLESPREDPGNTVVAPPAAGSETVQPITAAVGRPRWQWSMLWILLPIALALLVFVRGVVTPRGLHYDDTILFAQSPPQGTTLASGGILSPDSRYMVFVAHDQKASQTHLYLKGMNSVELRLMAGTEGASHPFWSPAGDKIGFFTNGELKTIDLRGDSPKVIAAVPVSIGGGTWSSSGPILFSDWQTGLYQVDPTDGRVIRVSAVNRSTGETEQKLPQFLPDGRHFLFFLLSANADQTGNYVGSLDSPKRVRILKQSRSPAIYSPPGYLLYVQDDVLMAQQFDASQLKVIGKPMIAARNVSAPGDAERQMISATANLLAFRSGPMTHGLAWFKRDGKSAGFIQEGKALRSPMFSPDQKQLVAMDDSGPGMWMVDIERGAATLLEGEGIYPLWSPDGNRIAFESYNSLILYVRNVSGPVQDEIVVNDNQRKILCDWSPTGAYLIYATLNPSNKWDLVLLPMSGDKKPIPFLHKPFNVSQGRVAPNGRWIAYASDESGTHEVYVQRFPLLGDKRIVSIGGGVEPTWRQDGRELFYLSLDYSIVSVPFNPAEPPQIGQPKPLFRVPMNTSSTRNHYAVAPDGQKFLINVEDQSSYLSPITLMVNWTNGLETP